MELIPFGPNVGYFNDGRDGYPIWVAGLSVAKLIYYCAKHNQAISSEGLPYTEIFRFYLAFSRYNTIGLQNIKIVIKNCPTFQIKYQISTNI